MLRGMVGSMLDSMGLADPGVVHAIKDDTDLMHLMANPQIVVAMRDISEDPSKLADYRGDRDVLGALDRVEQLAQVLFDFDGPGPDPEAQEVSAGSEQEPDDEARHRQQAENQHRRSQEAKARRRRSKAQRLEYDVEGWMDRPWYDRSAAITKCLQFKGFCVLKGGASSITREKAILEAARLRRSGAFTRPPQEVLSGLFGELGSAWTRELSDPNRPAPPEEEALRTLDAHIAELGGELCGCTYYAFAMRIRGRTVGVVHHSRMDDDDPNPPLLDPDEADGYMALLTMRKLKMVYYVGPSAASMRISPIEDEAQIYRSNLPPNTIIVLRGDICRLAVDPRPSEMGICVEVDFLAEKRMGPQECYRDRVPPPSSLEEWYLGRLEAIVENQDMDETVPDDWKMLARATFYNYAATPIGVREISQQLPAAGSPQDFKVSVLQGNDGVMEIPLSKWDISAYYDEDPSNVDDFKMYTRHMGVLGSGDPPSDEQYLKMFGLSGTEASNADPRHVMLCDSALSCLQMAGMGQSDTKRKNIGIFVGLSGNNEMYFRFISKEAKLGKSASGQMSNAANVNKMSFLFGSTGPSVAIDTEDSSGSSAVDTSISYLREERCEMTVAASVSLLQHPFSLIMHCATGSISAKGRCRVLDETADGVTRSDGVVTVLLQPRLKVSSEGEESPCRCVIRGSALNSRGVSSSLQAPNASAIHDVLQRALKDACCPVSVVQALDLNAYGSDLPDAMEVGVMQKATTPENSGLQTLALRNCKSIFGETGAPSGLANLLRACVSLERAVHGPCIHLRQLSEIVVNVQQDELTKGSRAIRPHLEVMEARFLSQTVGVNSFGGSGTSVHHVVWGERFVEQETCRPLSWFPVPAPAPADAEASGEDSEFMTADYYIVGTWNAWEEPLLMEKEAEGIFSHVLTLGENRWETFQILMNGDENKILHPLGSHINSQGDEVLGPSARSSCGRFMTWCVSGLPSKVWLINEAQERQLWEQYQQLGPDDEGIQLEHSVKTTFREDYKPSGYENATSYKEMPLIDTNLSLHGVPGDQYRVRFCVTGGGRYRRVEWSKVPTGAIVELPEFSHNYFVAGDHNFWCFSKMENQGGKHSVKVQLLGESTTFQVIRDKDWDQTFCPRVDNADQDAAIDFCTVGAVKSRRWKISGQAGDCFQVVFERSVSTDGAEDVRRISWKFIANEAVNPVEVSKDHRYHVVGSWNNSVPAEMDFNKDTGVFTFDMRVESPGEETFQILLNRNWLTLVYPSFKEATLDPNQAVNGPDTSGSRNCWVIGRYGDGARAGDLVRISLFIEAGLPKRVSWERVNGEVQSENVAQG